VGFARPVSEAATLLNVEASPIMPTQQIEDAIKRQYPNATDIGTHEVVSHFLDGSVYYAEFKVDGQEDFCYVFATNSNVSIYDDGESVIKEFKVMLDERRSIWQRLGEFTLTELVGAIIAMCVTGTFVYLSVTKAELNKEFLGIFSLIASYYFGRNVTK
jgi:hypothetical protein